MKTAVLATVIILVYSLSAAAQTPSDTSAHDKNEAQHAAADPKQDRADGLLNEADIASQTPKDQLETSPVPPPIMIAQARTEADLIAALELQGYQIDSVRRTLLGRVVIKARNDTNIREIVMSRSRGDVLSDQIVRNLSADGDHEARSGMDSDRQDPDAESVLQLRLDVENVLGLRDRNDQENDVSDRSSGLAGGVGGLGVGRGK